MVEIFSDNVEKEKFSKYTTNCYSMCVDKLIVHETLSELFISQMQRIF